MKYSIELWTPAGQMLADLSGGARSRRIILSRNEPDDITWDIDLAYFESYCRKSGISPLTALVPGQTEVRIKRGTDYLCGGQVSLVTPAVDSQSATLTIRANGFLSLFKDRVTGSTQTYTGWQGPAIAWDLINTSQSVANGSFGVTQGAVATTSTLSRTYQRQDIMSALQDLTTAQSASFDFEFTPTKVFNTYAAIGSQRPEVIFEYPGNIVSLQAPIDATAIANRIYMLGSGSGQLGNVQTEVDDTNSQLNYTVREKVVNESGVADVPTLTDLGNAELSAWSFPFKIPTIVVDGNKAPFVTDYHIGDYVYLKVGQFQYLNDINALHRIEKIDLAIDDTDSEQVTLYLAR